MKEMKRILSFVLCVVMLIGLVPFGVLAEETNPVENASISTFAGDTAADGLNDETAEGGESDAAAPADDSGDQSAQTETTPDETTPEETAPEETTADDGIMMIDDGIDAQAEDVEYPIYILAGGDFQEAGDHANSAANVKNILAQVSQKYATMDGFLFIGDYDCETHNSATETANGITALMGAVQSKYSNLNDANSVLVQGNHDYMDSRIDATGGHDFDGYAVYVLNEDDYVNGGGTQAGVQALANDMKDWLNNKIGEGYDAPVFITSHLPLAFSPRTVTQGDAKYAKYIFDVLNDAGKNGLNIIFLHGHDHAYGPDNYMGGEAIYLPVGDKICIAEAGSTSAWTEETLNFTYMNAGYTGYYSDAYTYVTTAGTDKLTMTVFAITEKEVTVERYSEDGTYNLKSAGYNGSYSNTSVDNVSLGLPMYDAVYGTPQTIKLAVAEELGTIGSWAGVAGEAADDVTTSNKGWVELIPPVPGTEETPGSTTYKYVLDTDGVNTNTKYLIVNTSSNGDAYVLTNNNGSVTRTLVSIANGEIIVENETNINWVFSGSTSGTVVNQSRYVYPNNGSLSFRDSGTNMTISNEDNGEYLIYRTDNSSRKLYVRYNNGWTATRVSSTSSTTYSVYLFAYDSIINTPGTEAVPGTNGTYGKIVGNLSYNATVGMTAEQAMALVQGGIDGYYYDAMSTPGDDVTGTKVEDSILTWEWVDTFDGNTAGDYEVAIKYGDFLLGTAEVVVPATTTYYCAEGNGLYIVDMNTSAANAMAAVKAGVTIYASADPLGANKTAVSDDIVTWNWVDSYSGTNSGPYTVEIKKDGVSLGTVEVKVNVRYETGIGSNWTYIGETEATGGTYTYTLDTDGIDYGEENKYIIVDDNEAIVLNAQSSEAGTAHSITINGNTAITNTRDYEYHVLDGYSYNGTSYHLITKGNGSQYLYQEANRVRYGTRSSVKFRVEHMGSGLYRIRDIDGDQWCVVYSGGNWTVLNTTNHPERVRFYKYTGTTGGTPGGPLYALIEGKTIYTVEQGTSATKALAAVKAGITGYTATDASGTGKTELADSDLKWTWKNTYNGNSTGSYWVDISYQGKSLGTVEVKVVPGVVNNYPEYPDEGAVHVSKTATGIEFQSSGVAQVEVSASGVPIKKGADVILMLDTSSSMTSHTVTGGTQTRAQVLEESLVNLIKQFKTPGDDGQLLDLRIAIADFNGFYGENQNSSGTPYDRDAADMMSDDISYNASSEAQVYTGDGTLGAGAFIPVEDLAASYTLNYTSGTNYDYAFDAIYQLGTAIKESTSEDRDLYVIFMSDGAAMQWNYYHSQGASKLWNNWLCGNWAVEDLDLNCKTHAYYYNDVDTDGDGMMNEHRMANAVKGDPTKTYEVIRKTDTLGTPTNETNMYMVPGLGATVFSISFDAQTDTNVTEETMDLSIETLASEQTGTTRYYYKVTTAAELTDAFDAIGTEIAYAATNARFVDQMGGNYNLQMTPIVDYDGDAITDANGDAMMPSIQIISYDIYTKAEADAIAEGTAGDDVTEAMIGKRKGTSTVLETVTFTSTKNEDGSYTVTGAYSDQIGGGKTNILADGAQEGFIKGVIYAKTFLYNTNATDVEIDGISIPTGTKADGTTTGSAEVLSSETFYWKMGTVQTSELAMRYYVYLEGSMEGTRPAGSYPTNEFATLYYDNYLGNPCKKETVSPVMAWKSANVSYAFYLVNEQGQIIVNQTTGQTGSFANKIAVTNPVVYEEILLNNTENIQVIDIAAVSDDVLPKYYTLYDRDAVYEITINSDATGAWEITKGAVTADSTYVMQYNREDQSAYSNVLTNNDTAYDYTHTVVWFAVVWSVGAHPDAVVVDYGLPVDINVLSNDMFGENGHLAGIGAYTEGLENTTAGASLQTGFGTNYTGQYGTAKADTSSDTVRYTLNTMKMDSYDKFAYAVDYSGSDNTGYYYDTITVIPATTIYYEDSFLTYEKWDNNGTPADRTDDQKLGTWDTEGTLVGATQDEDRPGKYSLEDANNIYGYDSVNLGMSTFSLGQARKVYVDNNSYATATFTFAGTGFDVISMTSNTTGTFTVQVTDSTGASVKKAAVNTYYGYNYVDGEWVADPSTEDALYQVPVIQIEELPYGTYTATITATYASALNKTEDENGYWLYLDAVRIYDPANDGAQDNDTVIEDAYKADGESWPSYIELRNKIIAANSFDNVANDALTTDMEGLVFIDGDESVGDAQIDDYKSYGPNNEVYLAPGQRVAFKLSGGKNSAGKDIVAQVHIGIKSADGEKATYTITNIAQAADESNKVEAGAYYNAQTNSVDTATDMYYDLTGWKDDIIVISNTGNRYDTTGIISLTNIKATYTENPSADVIVADAGDENDPNAGIMLTSLEEEPTNNEMYVSMSPAAAMLTLRSLNAPAVEETPDETIPEETVPEVTEPDETIPEETEPEETVPETTLPEETQPEIQETQPEETEPEVTEPEATEPKPEKPEQNQQPDVNAMVNYVVKKITNAIGSLLKKWFR